MPEYLPPLPNSIYQSIARSILAGGQGIAQGYSQLGQSLGNAIPAAVHGYLARRQTQAPTTSQLVSMGLLKPTYTQPPLPPGAQGPLRTQTAQQVFGNRPNPMTYRGILQTAGEEKAMEKAFALERMKESGSGKYVQISPEDANSKVGQTHGLVPGQWVPTQAYTAMFRSPTGSVQALTPEESAALVAAGQRKKNPLDLAGLKTRGYSTKIIAQELLKDPNYNPYKAIAQTSATKSGASESARLQQWPLAIKSVDPSEATGQLRVIGNNNLKANRAYMILQKPKITPQEQQMISTDMSAIMKGAAPDEELMRTQSYQNFQTHYASFLSNITSDPQYLDNPQVKKALMSTLKELVDADNEFLRGRINSAELEYAPLIKRDPAKWRKVVRNIEDKFMIHVKDPNAAAVGEGSNPDDPLGILGTP